MCAYSYTLYMYISVTLRSITTLHGLVCCSLRAFGCPCSVGRKLTRGGWVCFTSYEAHYSKSSLFCFTPYMSLTQSSTIMWVSLSAWSDYNGGSSHRKWWCTYKEMYALLWMSTFVQGFQVVGKGCNGVCCSSGEFFRRERQRWGREEIQGKEEVEEKVGKERERPERKLN